MVCCQPTDTPEMTSCPTPCNSKGSTTAPSLVSDSAWSVAGCAPCTPRTIVSLNPSISGLELAIGTSTCTRISSTASDGSKFAYTLTSETSMAFTSRWKNLASRQVPNTSVIKLAGKVEWDKSCTLYGYSPTRNCGPRDPFPGGKKVFEDNIIKGWEYRAGTMRSRVRTNPTAASTRAPRISLEPLAALMPHEMEIAGVRHRPSPAIS